MFIHNPRGSPGVILADESNPIDGLVFDNVFVTRGRRETQESNVNSVNGYDPYALFRGMDQPIHDHKEWFTRFFIYITLIHMGLFLIVSALTFICVKVSRKYYGSLGTNHSRDYETDRLVKRLHKSSEDVESPSQLLKRSFSSMKEEVNPPIISRILVQGVTFVFIAISAYIVHHTLMVTARMKDADDFFICKGVTGGVALGNSWPIPSCFEDRTTQEMHRGEGFLGLHNGGIVLMVETSITVILGYVYLSRLTRDWRYSDRQYQDETLFKQATFRIGMLGPRARYRIVTKSDGTRSRKFTDGSGSSLEM